MTNAFAVPAVSTDALAVIGGEPVFLLLRRHFDAVASLTPDDLTILA